MSKGKIFLIILGVGALCIIFYFLFPKYYVVTGGLGEDATIYRCNRITGKVQIASPYQKKWRTLR